MTDGFKENISGWRKNHWKAVDQIISRVHIVLRTTGVPTRVEIIHNISKIQRLILLMEWNYLYTNSCSETTLWKANFEISQWIVINLALCFKQTYYNWSNTTKGKNSAKFTLAIQTKFWSMWKQHKNMTQNQTHQ